jgi:serine phosphatase RsbU (regulator of sigma subunit)
MSGALMTMVGVTFLNEIINSEENLDANEILNGLREKVIQLLNQKGDIGEASNGMDITLCIYNEKLGTVQFAGANNSLYLVREGKKMEIFKGDRMPIGFFFEEEIPFTKQEFQISKDDTFYLFSDGYPDQFGGPFEKKFRYNQFRDLLLVASSYTSMDQQLDLIRNTIEDWMEGYEQIDDMLVMGFRFY